MYNCGYGLEDSIDDVLAVIKDITLKKVALNKKGKTIPIEKIETWTTTKSITLVEISQNVTTPFTTTCNL